MNNTFLCPSCKTENIPNTRFCADCGAIVQLDLSDAIDRYALRVFRLAGYCAPDAPIPKDVFRTALGMSPEPPEKNGVVDQAMLRLNALGVARAVQNYLSFDSVSMAAARKLDVTVHDKVLFLLATAMADLAFEAVHWNNADNCADYRPHLKAAVDWAEKARMERAVALCGCLGECQFLSKEYVEAKQSYGRALILSKEILGKNHARSAVCMCNLAKAYRALGDEPNAKKLDEEARQILENSLGANDPHTASALNDLGSVLHRQGEMVKAREYLERAVEIYVVVNGGNGPFLASASFNLGTLLQDLGDLDGALMHFQRALRIDEPLFGPKHPKVIVVKKRIRDLSNSGDAHRTL